MVPPQPTEAAGDQPLMISQRMRGRGTSQIGTWVAAGGINDEGQASVTQINGTTQDGTLLVVSTHLLVNDQGQLALRDRAILQPYPPPPPRRRVLLEGRWKLVSGTGAYADLRARGKLYATATDVVVDQGVDRELTLVRDGSAELEELRPDLRETFERLEGQLDDTGLA